MIYAYFTGLRVRLSLTARICLAVAAAAVCGALAWFGSGIPVEAALLVVVAIAAAALGWP